MKTPEQEHAKTAEQPAVRSVESEQLFQGAKTLLIRHADSEYRLTVTRNDKLILQK